MINFGKCDVLMVHMNPSEYSSHKLEYETGMREETHSFVLSSRDRSGSVSEVM